MKKLEDLAKNIYERLEYIEFMLRFRGWVSRPDLIERFGVGEAAATRDIRLYRDYREKNLYLNPKSKKYEMLEQSFNPLFDLKIQSALSKIRTSRICDALGMGAFDGILCPPRLSFPKIEFLSTITRAISGAKGLSMTYRSTKNGESKKEIKPHAIFDNGIHWYIRAFDEKSKEYRTYALTRIVELSMDSESNLIRFNEIVDLDFQWSRMVKLELIPHPNRNNVSCPETIEHDLDMVDGKLTVTVRAAVVGYWLHHWSVDCTENHSLKGYDYQLWLNNHQTLYDVESRQIAPGLSTYFNDIKKTHNK
jgi:predicted DNA-binding transcriptional regulator YafY